MYYYKVKLKEKPEAFRPKEYYYNCLCDLYVKDGYCAMDHEEGKCPLEELKPKQLEWIKDEDSGCIISDATFGKYKIRNGSASVVMEDETKGRVDCILNFRTIPEEDNLKELCQRHYNKIFYEMVGGKVD